MAEREPIPVSAEQNQIWEHQHAIDGPEYWCNGRFSSIPIRFVGLGHSMSRNGWPVYRCLECGEEIFIDQLRPHDTIKQPPDTKERSED